MPCGMCPSLRGMWLTAFSKYLAAKIFQARAMTIPASIIFQIAKYTHRPDCQVHTPPGQNFPSTPYDFTCEHHFPACHVLQTHTAHFYPSIYTRTFLLHYFSLFLGNPLIELVTRRKVAPLSLTQVKVHWRRPFIINLWKSIGISILCLR